MTLAGASATVPDLLRLVALPVFAWAAVRDVRTRRVSSAVWIPLAIVGGGTLVWDGWIARQAGGPAWTYDFLVPAAISLGLVVPIAYLFWWLGGFGGADAKALLVLALLFPTFPEYTVGPWTLPVSGTPIEAFSFTILSNAVLVGLAIPIALAVRNAAAGRVAPVMFVGWPVSWERVAETHGTLLSTPTGVSRTGLDLDALRMYLRWRGLTLAELRDAPDRYRDPATLPDEPNPPTDGAVAAGPDVRSDGGTAGSAAATAATDAQDADRTMAAADDPWGAAAFLDDIEGTAYGTTADELREGLEVLAETETVWISPGAPFLVPVFAGLVIALLYGDLLVGTIV
ncbi:A24 family peptidase C-terminal domain-containing protein [Halosolutus halophilus]|uniref:A24 family peptidase C-terminal domain-containing protein n=1 Tax=Halosolutus halophilus TaxID=1552990 RepID=UPI00223520DF|nr:A24 family peptidase C-terminal domain-containing protein [Halosolutus halophilus]